MGDGTRWTAVDQSGIDNDGRAFRVHLLATCHSCKPARDSVFVFHVICSHQSNQKTLRVFGTPREGIGGHSFIPQKPTTQKSSKGHFRLHLFPHHRVLKQSEALMKIKGRFNDIFSVGFEFNCLGKVCKADSIIVSLTRFVSVVIKRG